jgi:orotate phosphoribosyltransferase-like protein
MSKMKAFIADVLELYEQGFSISEIAQKLGGSLDLVEQVLEMHSQ